MTLVLSLLNEEYCIVATDRRLTADGRLISDERTKLTLLRCIDARVAVAFSGLAALGGFRTDRWIAATLADLAKPDYAIAGIMDRFKTALTDRWRKLKTPAEIDKRLSVILSGYVNEEGGPRAYSWLLSNWERDNTVLDGPPLQDFELLTSRERRPKTADEGLAVIRISGVLDVVPEDDLLQLSDLLMQGASARDLTRRAVGIIRNVSDLPASRGLVGKQCLSVIVPSDFGQDHESHYHSVDDSDVSYDINQALAVPDAAFAVADPELRIEPAGRLVRGDVARNAPCPCGSGKKYKRCHGL